MWDIVPGSRDCGADSSCAWTSIPSRGQPATICKLNYKLEIPLAWPPCRAVLIAIVLCIVFPQVVNLQTRGCNCMQSGRIFSLNQTSQGHQGICGVLKCMAWMHWTRRCCLQQLDTPCKACSDWECVDLLVLLYTHIYSWIMTCFTASFIGYARFSAPLSLTFPTIVWLRRNSSSPTTERIYQTESKHGNTKSP